MLGLLNFLKKQPGPTVNNETDKICTSQYTKIGGCTAMDKGDEVKYMELKKSSEIHDLQVPDHVKEICDDLCLSEDDTDDSGCHCSDSVLEDQTSSHNNSFHDDSFSSCTKDPLDTNNGDGNLDDETKNHSNGNPLKFEANTISHSASPPEQNVYKLPEENHMFGITLAEDVSEDAEQNSDCKSICGEDEDNQMQTNQFDSDKEGKISADEESSMDEEEEEEEDGDESEEDAAESTEDNQVSSKVMEVEEEEEGGWISDESQQSSDHNQSDAESDDEMFDLFGDKYDSNYEEDFEYPYDMDTSHSAVNEPVLPPRKYNVCTYPPKKNSIYTRQIGVQDQTNPRKFKNDSNNVSWYGDDSEVYTYMASCSKAPSVKKGGYAFPRCLPDEITDVCDFWETDFQVNNAIIPKMGSWERLGVVPQRGKNVKDYQQYMTYKTLYLKWIHSNKSKEQWYRKYGLRSLDSVLFFKPKSYKQYPDECQPIEGLREKLEMFEIYYDCLSANKHEPKMAKISFEIKGKCPEFTFTTSVSTDDVGMMEGGIG